VTLAQRILSRGAHPGQESRRRLNELRTYIPFVLPNQISPTRPTHCGRGMIVPVTGQANTEITVTHNLGRIVQGAWALANTNEFNPRIKLTQQTATKTQQSLVADANMSSCFIMFF
jgi:hypothetical protein